MSMGTATATAWSGTARLRALPGARLLEREAPLVALVGFYVLLMAFALPHMLVQDSWLTLAAGRDIVQHGLPHSNRLTIWDHGDHWVDQQWLAQIGFYGVERLGGMRLVLLVHAALMTAGFAVSLAAARARGATPRSVALVATTCLFVAPWGLQLRAQSFAPVLFAGLLWLLVSDSRRPGRRVLVVLPMLVLWANLHGTVIVAALLVALRGLTILGERRARVRNHQSARTREALLLLASPVLVLASPYGTSLVAYYRQMLDNPLFRSYVSEWQASAPSARTAVFYCLALVAVVLVARQARQLTRFELLALAALAVGALASLRSIVWFALAATIILPALLERELPQGRHRGQTHYRAIAKVAGLATIVLATLVTATRPDAWFEQDWPTGALPIVARQLESPGARVIADDHTADWLLWELPGSRGRVAYDIRFELLSARQFAQLARYRSGTGTHWRSAALGYDTVVLDAADVAGRDLGSYGTPLYDDGSVIVLHHATRG
jgi:hypothetical protein